MINFIIEHKFYIIDCKSNPDWRGVYGMDIDKLDPATGNSVAIYSQKSLAECKILCESAGSCYSIHYHPFQNSAFNGCQLKYKIFTDQSQITNYDGTWTSYWLFDCSSGNLCCYYFFDIHIEEALKITQVHFTNTHLI